MIIHKLTNEAVEGERIVCEYSKLHGIKLLHTSESHRGTRCTLDDAICYITKPLRATQYKK